LKIKRSENTKKSEIQKWDIGKPNNNEVKEFIKEVTRSVRYKWNTEQNQKGITEAAVEKKKDHKEITGRLSILEDNKTAYNNMINKNTRQNEQEYMNKRQAAYK